MQMQSTAFSKRTIPNPFPTKRVLAETVWKDCEKCCLMLPTPLLKALQVLSRTWVSTKTLPSERPSPFQKHSFSTIYMTYPENTKVTVLALKDTVLHLDLSFSKSPRTTCLRIDKHTCKGKKKQIPRLDPKPTDSNFLRGLIFISKRFW